MEIKQIEYNGKEYQKVIVLRNELLRKPIGLDIKDDDLTIEYNYTHIAVLEGDEVIGTCQFKPIDSKTVLMKQVCVNANQQGKQIGSKMFAYSVELLKAKGIETIQVHARTTAVGFYKKVGFIPSGDIFTEVGIDHQYMEYKVCQN